MFLLRVQTGSSQARRKDKGVEKTVRLEFLWTVSEIMRHYEFEIFNGASNVIKYFNSITQASCSLSGAHTVHLSISQVCATYL